MSTCRDMAVTSSHLVVGDVVSRATRRTPAKVSQHSMLSLTKYYLKHIENDAKYLADELIDHHSQNVNPKDLVVSSNFFQTLALEPGFQNFPFVRHYLTLTQYTKEKTRSSAGQPDTAAFLDPQALVNFSKCIDLVETLEEELKSSRGKYITILERQLAPQQARYEFACLGDLLIRSAFSKALPAHLRIKGGSGKLTSDKILLLKRAWAKIIDDKYPDLGFSAEAKLNPEDHEATSEHKLLMEKVDSKHLSKEPQEPQSATADADDKGFKPGDEVTVIRRFTVELVLSSKSNHRKDVSEGIKGIVKGYADDKHRQILMEMSLHVPLKHGSKKLHWMTFVERTYPRNLERTEVVEKDKKNDALAKASKTLEDSPAADGVDPDEGLQVAFIASLCVGSSSRGQGREALGQVRGRRG